MQKRTKKSEDEQPVSIERFKILDVERIVELCLEHIFITKVLEVGTGTGSFAEAFSLRNLEVTGIDKNPAMIKIASDTVRNAQFREASAEKLPFADRSFDLVFITHILHTSSDPILILKEAGRVASSRVALLEWQFSNGKNGPSPPKKIAPEEIKKIAHLAGLSSIKKTDLEFMVLYRMKPGKLQS